MTTTMESKPIQAVSNDFYSLNIGMKQSILTQVMKKFIEEGKKVPSILLSDLKKVKKQNKKGEGYILHMECKNTQRGVKVYYKQYKHLDKYYPKQIDVMRVGSLQRGERAVDIEKKYEKLIRLKTDSHIWTYGDKEDSLIWIKADIFKTVKKNYSRWEKDNHIKKLDLKIGDVDWYAIELTNESPILNYGISSLTNEMVYGFTAMFDNKKSRDDYYDYIMK